MVKSMDTTIRKPLIDETDALLHIWKTVFDDGGESTFFDYYYDPELCLVSSVGDVPVAAGYLIPTGNLIHNEISFPCAMIYGVATLPEFRNLGFAAAIVRKLTCDGFEAGFPVIALCPSGDSMFEFYSSHTEFRDWFYIQEHRYCTASESPPVSQLVEMPPGDYGRLRETFLSDIPHIEPDIRALSYQKSLCGEFGGGLFQIDTSGGISCATIERQNDGAVWVKELLTPGGVTSDILQTIASGFPAEEYIVRTPSRFCNSQFIICNSKMCGSPQTDQKNNILFNHFDGKDVECKIQRFGMLASTVNLPGKLSSNSAHPWFGFAFD